MLTTLSPAISDVWGSAGDLGIWDLSGATWEPGGKSPKAWDRPFSGPSCLCLVVPGRPEVRGSAPPFFTHHKALFHHGLDTVEQVVMRWNLKP